jgi:phage recombination protein Bet
MCQARKLNPFEGDAFLLGYDGHDGPKWSLVTAHQAFLKRAEMNAEYDGMESGVVVDRAGEISDVQGDMTYPGDKLLGGWARVHFRNRKFPMYKRLNLSSRRKATRIWDEDTAGMITKCAEADALRSSFPTMLGGLYTIEELPDAKGVEIMEPKIPTPPRQIKETAVEPEQEPPPAPIPASYAGQLRQTPMTPAENAAAQSRQPQPEPPEPPKRVSKKKQTLQVKKKEAPLTEPNREKLNARLKVGGFTEADFLAVANENEWLGKGRKWDSLDDVDDDMLEVFLRDEEWQVVMAQLEATVKEI